MTEENIKLFDSELKVMDVLWKDGDVPAKYVADTLNREVGWNKNTTYTLIKRCINKGAIERTEPGFMCHALIAKEQVQDLETDELIDKIYDGSVDKLFAALLGRKKLSMEQIKNLKQIVSELECGDVYEPAANEFSGNGYYFTYCGIKGCAYQQITEENIFDFMVDCINTVISSIFHKISHKYLFSVAEYLF